MEFTEIHEESTESPRGVSMESIVDSLTPRCTLQPSGMAVASKTDTSCWAPARAVAPLLCGPFLDQVVSIYDIRHIY